MTRTTLSTAFAIGVLASGLAASAAGAANRCAAKKLTSLATAISCRTALAGKAAKTGVPPDDQRSNPGRT